MSTAVGVRGYTTAFAASRYLYAQLRDSTRPELTGVTRSWGYPGDAAGDEIVWVGGFEPADQEPAALGQGQRDENYRINVYVDVAKTTSDPLVVNERLERLTHVIEDLIHEDNRLGGAVMWAQIAGVSTQVETQPATEAAYGGVTRVQVGCRARV